MNKYSNNRYWEIDTLRGIAIISMIIHHILIDLDFFDVKNLNFQSGPLWISARLTASIFIFLVGLSLTISYSKSKEKLSSNQLTKKYILRGGKIFGYGLFITIITYFLIGDGFVVFGILHFIGLSIILAYPFLKYGLYEFIWPFIIAPIGFYLKNLDFSFYWLLWIGFRPEGFHSLDYYPLFPWFAVVLIGILFGKKLYSHNERYFNIPDLSEQKGIKGLSYLGRNSLIIYLVHQPIVIIIMIVLGVIQINSFL